MENFATEMADCFHLKGNARKYVLLFCLTLFSSFANAQCDKLMTLEAYTGACGAQSVVINRQETGAGTSLQLKYLKRHKTYKALAWTSLSLGIAATASGYLFSAAGAVTQNDGNGHFGEALFYSGLSVAAVSVPLFVIAHQNKVKAGKPIRVSLNTTVIQAVTSFGQTRALPVCGIGVAF